jgi:hypothetical protein
LLTAGVGFFADGYLNLTIGLGMYTSITGDNRSNLGSRSDIGIPLLPRWYGARGRQ